MADLNVTFPGAINGIDATPAEQRAMLLTLFAEEVRQVYFSKTMMREKIHVKQLEGGKEFMFPLVGRTAAAYHTPGAEITGDQILHNQQKVSIDGQLVASVAIDKLNDKLNMYDVRSYYANALGEALAYSFERNSYRSVCLAARASHPITGEPGGSTIYGIDITTGTTAENAKALYEAIKEASRILVTKDRDPKYNETWCTLTPENYYLLLDHLDLLNRDYAGSGSLLTADVPMIANIKIDHSNLFEAGVNVLDAADGNYEGKYTVDMTDTIGLIWNKEAVGCVQALDIQLEAEYSVRHQSDFIVASQAHGWGTLIPTNAIELSTAVAP